MTFSLDMVMEGCYTQDKLRELYKQIGTLHLIYLEKEEDLQKLHQREKLEECIKQYLCLAPHNRKFIFPETANVLHRSASTMKEFSAYRAAPAWNAIATYAGNLLNQSWRNEYKEIKMYSGFYKHQIDANLIGAEVMFEAMGYKHAGDSVLVLDGPICPDQVIGISQDCLVAYVECQILKAIWEQVSANFKVTWLEVLEFRETHLCSPQQSVQAINYRIHERQYQQHTRSYSQGTEQGFANNARFTSNLHYSAPSLPVNHSFPPPHAHAAPPAQCIYGAYGNYPACAPVLPPPCAFVSYPKPAYYCSNGFAAPMYGYGTPAPIAHPSASAAMETNAAHAHYDAVDGPSNSRTTASTRSDLVRRESQTTHSKSTNCDNELSASDPENWEYVYKNLESLGYSKDLGERGDLLKTAKRAKPPKEGKKKPLDEFSNLSVRDRALKHKDKSESSTVMELAKSTAKSSMNGVMRGAELRPNAEAAQNKRKEGEKEAKGDPVDVANKWECSSCTYLNVPSKDVCEICHKSKIKIKEVMEIGGPQCRNCTLVNPRSNEKCEACHASLENSPTYI